MNDDFYVKLAKNPWRYILWLLAGMLFTWCALSLFALEFYPNPFSFSVSKDPWSRSLQVGTLVVQIATFVVVVVGAFIPIAKWLVDRSALLKERVKEITEQKPVVMMESLPDGRFQIANVGEAPAMNVWLVVEHFSEPVFLGSLDVHQTRELPLTVRQILDGAGGARHILVAATRPHLKDRPYTPTFHVRTWPAGQFAHGFRPHPSNESLKRTGSIQHYLSLERADLLAELHRFCESPLNPA